MNPIDPYNIRDRLMRGSKELAEQVQEAKGDAHHFRGLHIYCNFDFSNAFNTPPRFQSGYKYNDLSANVIKENHCVHLFYHKIQPCVEDGKLREFITKAHEVTKKKVIVHVPKHEEATQIAILMAIADLSDICQIIVEKKTHVTVFRHHNCGPREVLCVGWGAPNQKVVSIYSEKGAM